MRTALRSVRYVIRGIDFISLKLNMVYFKLFIFRYFIKLVNLTPDFKISRKYDKTPKSFYTKLHNPI